MKDRENVQSIEVSTIAHATEDLDSVQSALARLLPDSLKGKQLFTRQYLQGHYGNPIVTFEALLTKPGDISDFKGHLLRMIPATDKVSILHDLDRHTDESGHLYIRLDKQKMFRGIVTLTQDDPIRVKMKFTRYTGSAFAQIVNYFGAE